MVVGHGTGRNALNINNKCISKWKQKIAVNVN